MNDLRYALRQLRKSPGFTLIAVLTLALGIGANTAIFSVVNAVLLKPLPFPAPEQLVLVGGQNQSSPDQTGTFNSISYPEFFDLRARNQGFAQLAAYRDKAFAFLDGREVQNLRGQRVTGNFFAALGVEPALGRAFQLEDEAAGGGPGGLKVILSNEFWRRQFNASPDALGRQLTLDRQPFTVVGVMPAGFQYPIQAEATDIYVTIAIDAVPVGDRMPSTALRDNRQMRCLGRLHPGVSLEQAREEMHTLALAIKKEHPTTNADWNLIVRPLRDHLVANVRVALWIFCGAVLCVLLIACVNVANLMLARASSRVREMAVRLAIGAGRGRIVRQLLVESLLLAALGGGFGLLLAQWGTDALVALTPKEIPRAANIQFDWAVLLFTLTISFATGILFGVTPALQATRIDLNEALKANARGAIGGDRRTRLGRSLVVGQIALTLILLVGAGLLLQSFARLGQVESGLRTDRLLTARLVLPGIAYPNPQKIAAFHEQLLARLRILPGVREATTTHPLPLSGALATTHFDLADHPLPESQQPNALGRVTDPDFFLIMGIPLLQGRVFSERDRLDSKPVVIINERFAKKYFPGQDPVGKQMRPGWAVGDEPPLMREIIGVVGNVKQVSLQEDSAPEIYLPVAQIPWPITTILLRTETSKPEAMADLLRAEVTRLDPNLPLTAVRAFDEYHAASLAGARFNALLLSSFAGVALLLTAVGIYGVIAYSVSQRTGEFGLRMALGAQRRDVMRLVLRQGAKLIVFGSVIGLAGALLASRVLRSILFQTSAQDPLTLGLITLVLAAVALFACFMPARRATKVDPMIALRAE